MSILKKLFVNSIALDMMAPYQLNGKIVGWIVNLVQKKPAKSSVRMTSLPQMLLLMPRLHPINNKENTHVRRKKQENP